MVGSWVQCPSPKPLGHQATRQFIGNLTCTCCRRVVCECFGPYGTRSCVIHVVGFWGGPKLEANVCRLNPSAKVILCKHSVHRQMMKRRKIRYWDNVLRKINTHTHRHTDTQIFLLFYFYLWAVHTLGSENTASFWSHSDDVKPSLRLDSVMIGTAIHWCHTLPTWRPSSS